MATSSYAANILILGDSLSAAYGISEEQGWVQLLQDDLPQHHIINASVSGETSSGALRRLPALFTDQTIDLVVIELGGNDGLRGFPPQQLKENLTQLIQLSQQANAKVLLTEIMVPPNYGPRYSQKFNQVYQDIASKMAVELIPFFMTDIAPKSHLMQRDSIHPNAEAQPLINQWMQPYIVKNIDE
ncbi:arylesterase [Shewanella sp. NIFS-20-20]|uniref:arylesterase n=1 Tax=Shewanella sp. NIFS-20-20 TaxID=2853806 RepID=UPI003526F634